MHSSQYRKIANHPLRWLFRSMVTHARDLPTRSELREAIDEAVPASTNQDAKDALFAKAEEFAHKAATDPGSWWNLRSEADRFVLSTIEEWEEAERIVPLTVDEEIDSAGLAGAIFEEAALAEGRFLPAVGDGINHNPYQPPRG